MKATEIECYDRIYPWLQSRFGSLVTGNRDTCTIDLSIGSALARVSVERVLDKGVVVTIRAKVVEQPPLREGLTEYLLRETDKMPFGSFSVSEAGDVLLQHVVLGSDCHKQTLCEAVRLLVETADRYDEIIAERWGGKPAVETMRW